MPLLQRLMAAQSPPGAVARGGKGVLRPQDRADHYRRRRAHAAADEYRLTCRREGLGQIRMPRAESSRRPFAVNEQAAELARKFVLFLLAGVVRDVEQHRK